MSVVGIIVTSIMLHGPERMWCPRVCTLDNAAPKGSHNADGCYPMLPGKASGKLSGKLMEQAKVIVLIVCTAALLQPARLSSH